MHNTSVIIKIRGDQFGPGDEVPVLVNHYVSIAR